MILIFLIIFLLFGAKKLPELARGLGKSLGEFKKAKEDFSRELLDAEEKEKQAKPEEKTSAAPAIPASSVAKENPYISSENKPS